MQDLFRQNGIPSWDSLVKCGRVDPKAAPNPPTTIAPVLLVISGGAQSGQAAWLRAGKLQYVTSSEIKLPAQAKWDALLKQAIADLGPMPPPMVG